MTSTRQLAAIMFTDIVGYTAMMQFDEKLGRTTAQHYRKTLEREVTSHGGTVVQNYGDGSLSTFSSAVEAVHCAIRLQLLFAEDPRVPLRVGIHIGDIVTDQGEIYGDGINVASRIESMGVTGAVLVSEAVGQNLKNHLDIQLTSLGYFDFKNVEEPIEVFAVGNQGLVIPNPENLRGKFKEQAGRSHHLSDSAPLSPRKILLGVGTLIILLLAGYFGYYWLTTTSRVFDEASQGQTIRTLAVLPIDNLTGDSTQNNLIAGMHDNLITTLSQITSLNVISRTSSLSYALREDKTIPQIASELGVDAIIEASVLRSGDSLRINVQLIRAVPTETHLWAQVFDRPFTDILYLFDDVSQSIAKEINTTLIKRSAVTVSSPREIDPVAFKAYLNGMFYLNNLPSSENLSTALDYFERSIKLDTTYAPAYAGMAAVWIFRWQLRMSPGPEAVPTIYTYNQKALELDENYAEAQYIKALMSLQSEWNWEKSEAAFKSAIESNPNHALAHAHYGHLLMHLQRFDESISQMEEATRLDPLSPFITGLYAVVLWHYGALDEALELTAQDSSAFARPLIQESISSIKGQHQKSLDLLEAIFGAIPAIQFQNIKDQFRDQGYQSAMKMLAESLEQVPLMSAVFISVLYNRAGLQDEAVRVLEEGYRNHDPDMPYAFVPVELENLESHPGYQALAHKMKLPI
ncbi:MAG: hypothetical protein OER04_15815 [Cyclobacteriaceae bacterium]|nr:hypothetical protein [Cyclobacteriaceae bacterium]